jgi:hypothetical protein
MQPWYWQYIFINQPLQEHLAPVPTYCIIHFFFSVSVFNVRTGLLIIKQTTSLTNGFFLH